MWPERYGLALVEDLVRDLIPKELDRVREAIKIRYGPDLTRTPCLFRAAASRAEGAISMTQRRLGFIG